MSAVDQGASGAARAWREPDPRPFGAIALGLALLSALLAPSYFFSLFAYPVAVLALALGVAARGVARIRTVGTAATIIAALAIMVATSVLLLF